MCGVDPFSIAMGIGTAAMSAAGSVAQYQGQQQQYAEQKRVQEETRRSAIAAHNAKSTEINRRQIQEEDAASQKVHQQNVEEAKLRSETEVQAASGGVAGISLDNLLADVTRGAATNRQTLKENARMTAQQLELEKKGSAAEAQSRINSAPNPSKPSGLSLVAGLGSAALSGVNAYKRTM